MNAFNICLLSICNRFRKSSEFILVLCLVQILISCPDKNAFLYPRWSEPFNDQCSHHVETSQLICRANQLTGFYMMGTLAIKEFPGYTAGSFENVLRILPKYFQSIFSKFAFRYPVTLIKKVSTKDFTREFAVFFQVNYLIDYLRTTPLSTRECL